MDFPAIPCGFISFTVVPSRSAVMKQVGSKVSTTEQIQYNTIRLNSRFVYHLTVTLTRAHNSPGSFHQAPGERDVPEALGHQVDQEHLALHQFPEDHEDPRKEKHWTLEPLSNRCSGRS